MGTDAPFLSKTKLSEKRFSRQFTLAQICINSFSRNESGEFVRARYDDLEEFFKENHALAEKDENLVRIRRILELMDKHFGDQAIAISSRAVAVTAYLFVESLYLKKSSNLIPEFVRFFIALLDEIKHNLHLLTNYQEPTNTAVLENFQKYISQASVEPYAIRRRHEFLERAFQYYRSVKGKGKIIRRA
jgi:hypothetical protein